MRVPNSVYGGVLSIGVASLALMSSNMFGVVAAAPEAAVGELQIGQFSPDSKVRLGWELILLVWCGGIEVKSRPESCLIKTRKGDKLDMH